MTCVLRFLALCTFRSVSIAEGGGDSRFLYSSKRPGRLWGPRSLLFSGNRGLSPGLKRSGCEVNHWLHPASRFRMTNFTVPSRYARVGGEGGGGLVHWDVQGQSKKIPNIWNSAPVSRRRTLATVVLCSWDFKLYFDTSHITPLSISLELRGLEWTCV